MVNSGFIYRESNDQFCWRKTINTRAHSSHNITSHTHTHTQPHIYVQQCAYRMHEYDEHTHTHIRIERKRDTFKGGRKHFSETQLSTTIKSFLIYLFYDGSSLIFFSLFSGAKLLLLLLSLLHYSMIIKLCFVENVTRRERASCECNIEKPWLAHHWRCESYATRLRCRFNFHEMITCIVAAVLCWADSIVAKFSCKQIMLAKVFDLGGKVVVRIACACCLISGAWH